MVYDDQSARSDFGRQRRRHAVSRIAARLKQEPDDVRDMLQFEEVVAALGEQSRTDLGLQLIPLDSIVGTVGRRTQEFDRAFRPTTDRLRDRWQRVATQRESGTGMPPIDVYRIGELHFVEDGHHRVSVARAKGDTTIEAHVREVRTQVPAPKDLLARHLGLKRHERMFHQRVPLPPEQRAQIQLSDEWRYAQLATLIEARGFRQSHATGKLLSREELARSWFEEQYRPIVAILADTGLGGEGTDTDRYLRFALLRYLLLYTTEWDDNVVERLMEEVRAPRTDDDTLVHKILKEMQ
jgi:hypothetical protein